MKQFWIKKERIAELTTKIIGGIYAFIGFIGSLVPLDEILPNTAPIFTRVKISLSILLCVWVICFLIVGLILSLQKRSKQITFNNGHKLYLQIGDLFDENIVINPCERRNIIIPVNRCFDTIVDNRLISEKTLHGIAFKKLYKMNIYTEDSLNSTIQQLLCYTQYDSIQLLNKTAGNVKRFPVGTVVDLPVNKKEHFLLWALSTFDSNLKAHTSMQEYALAVQKLVEACGAESEGFPVVLPLVGTGLSRTNRDQKDVIQYLLSVFKLNKSQINCDIHIVVRTDIKN